MEQLSLFDDLGGTKKTATALTVTVIKSSSFITLPQTFKRRSTTTKSRLASYTVNGISARAKVKQFVDKSKLMDLINNFHIDNAEDFIKAIGKCFPQQCQKEEKNPNIKYKSKYQLLDFSQFGVKILFRISNHNIDCDNIIEDIEETYSIALKSQKSRKTFKPNDLTVTEYVYFTENCDRHRYLLIAKELYRFLETSEWDNSFVPADAINHSPNDDLAGIRTGIAANIEDDALFQETLKKYGNNYIDAASDIFKKFIADARYQLNKPLPNDWKRVINMELAKYIKDGDIIATHKDLLHNSVYRVYTDAEGDLRYYIINEQGKHVYLDKDRERLYLKYKDDPRIFGRDRLRCEHEIVNGKVRYYYGYPIHKRTNSNCDFQIIYIKPTAPTAPTNSRLRLLKIQAQAKIKLQQQRMRA